jgi:hypothetical protein
MQLDFTGSGSGQLVPQIVIPNGIEGGVKEPLYPDLQNQRKASLSQKPPK